METKTRDGKIFTDISNLKGWEKNPRSIDKSAFKRLCEQVRRLGQYKPLLCTAEGEVLGGNMRLLALRELKVTDVWVSIVNPKDEATKIQYALSDNDRAGYYNEDSLAELLGELEEIDLDLFHVDLGNTTSARDLYDRYREVEEDDFDPDSVPADSPIAQKGDLYQLGQHRLLCGDSISPEDVDKLLGGKRADMTFTDPPYLMKFDGSIDDHGNKSHNSKHAPINNDALKGEEAATFLYNVVANITTYTKGAFYICFYRLGLHQLFKAMEDAGTQYRNIIIWKKNNHNLSNSDYKSIYEPIIYGYADDYEAVIYGWGEDHIFRGAKNERDVWDVPSVWNIDRTKKNDLHPTMKPLKLPARAIKNSSKEGDVVLDLFGGGGSTLIACEQLNRQARIMELDPHYVDVIIARWEQFTGEKAVKIT